MYSTYKPSTISTTSNALAGAGVWTIIALILAIVGGILIYFLFTKKKNTFKGFLAWAHDFLNFKSLFIEAIMKIAYCIGVIFVTLFSFGLISIPGLGFVSFLLVLTLGNVALRVTYEFMMLTLIIVGNTTDIARKVCGTTDKSEKK